MIEPHKVIKTFEYHLKYQVILLYVILEQNTSYQKQKMFLTFINFINKNETAFFEPVHRKTISHKH